MEYNRPQIQLNDHADGSKELVIKPKPASRFVVSVLFILSMITFLLPIFIGVGIVLSGAKIGIGIFIPTGFFILIGVFIYRSYLWNAYGREVFLFEKNSVRYYCDYKRFRDRKIQLEGEIHFSVLDQKQLEVENETMDIDAIVTLVRLQFSIGGDQSLFLSHVDLPKTVIDPIMREVQSELGYKEHFSNNEES